jgi:hypothetical protein
MRHEGEKPWASALQFGHQTLPQPNRGLVQGKPRESPYGLRERPRNP